MCVISKKWKTRPVAWGGGTAGKVHASGHLGSMLLASIAIITENYFALFSFHDQ